MTRHRTGHSLARRLARSGLQAAGPALGVLLALAAPRRNIPSRLVLSNRIPALLSMFSMYPEINRYLDQTYLLA